MRESPTVHEVIYQIHQAALDPDEWPTVIGQLQDMFSSTAAGLFVQNCVTYEYKGGYLLGIESQDMETYEAYYAQKNPWFSPVCLMQPDRVLTEQSLDEYYKEHNRYIKTEFYNNWARKLELRHVLCSTLIRESNDLVNFTYFRSASFGPYTSDEINQHKLFARHIRQALMVNQRLQGINLWKDAAASLVEQLPCGIIFLDNEGRVLYLNSRAKNATRKKDGLMIKNGELLASSAANNRQLQGQIQKTLRGLCTNNPPNSLVLARSSGNRPLSLMLVPISTQRQLFTSEKPALILFLIDPKHQVILESSYLRQRYNFTVAEARVVRCLVQGMDLKAAAHTEGITYETARSYLKQIFQKTETSRQPDLIRLLLTDFAALLGG